MSTSTENISYDTSGVKRVQASRSAKEEVGRRTGGPARGQSAWRVAPWAGALARGQSGCDPHRDVCFALSRKSRGRATLPGKAGPKVSLKCTTPISGTRTNFKFQRRTPLHLGARATDNNKQPRVGTQHPGRANPLISTPCRRRRCNRRRDRGRWPVYCKACISYRTTRRYTGWGLNHG